MKARAVLLCALLLMGGCALLPPSDPERGFRMDEWRSERHEGRAFHESRNRPYSVRLAL